MDSWEVTAIPRAQVRLQFLHLRLCFYGLLFPLAENFLHQWSPLHKFCKSCMSNLKREDWHICVSMGMFMETRVVMSAGTDILVLELRKPAWAVAAAHFQWHWEFRTNWTDLPRDDKYMQRQLLCTKDHMQSTPLVAPRLTPPEVSLPLRQ